MSYHVNISVLVSFKMPVPGKSPAEQLKEATRIVSETITDAFGDEAQIEFYSVEPSSAQPAP